MKLSVLMPVYNERNTVQEALAQVLAVDLGEIAKEVILVDDASTDGTREILKGLEAAWQGGRWELPRRGLERLAFCYHDENRGKGAALRTGLQHATGEFTGIQDADLEYDPEEYPRLLTPILQGRAQVVYGSRFAGERRNMFFWHWVGNRVLTLLTNLLYDSTLSDMETGHKVFRTEVLKGLVLRSNRFDIEPEVTAKLLKRGIRIHEVPITYWGREYHEGKKITWRDGLVALWTLLKYRFVD